MLKVIRSRKHPGAVFLARSNDYGPDDFILKIYPDGRRERAEVLEAVKEAIRESQEDDRVNHD